ncbi:hypothetical protein EI94DRAFT_1726283 [Lactarius quietus]|nr:hypothetical protein EI94DRAFT_1726283 [Lactarius quietus]
MHSTHFPLSCSQMVVTVFLVMVYLTSAQASFKEDVPMYPTWRSAGCYSDSNPNRSLRALSTEVTVPGGLNNASVENCIGECESLTFNMAGLNEQTCWCSNKGPNAPSSVSGPIDKSNCRTPCTGDSNEYCGGNGAILIYEDTRVNWARIRK